MVTGETGFDDVTFDLIPGRYHSLRAGHDHVQYVPDAKSAGMGDVAAFFSDAMAQDSERARRCHGFAGRLRTTSSAGPAGPVTRTVTPRADVGKVTCRQTRMRPTHSSIRIP